MNIIAYLAIAAEAEQIGWPLFHATDLTEKDAHTCAALHPDDAFVWVLREAGTSMLIAHPDLDPIVVQSRLASLDRFGGPCRYFWWDQGVLEELGDAEEAAFVLESRCADLRQQRRDTASARETMRCAAE